MLLPAPPAVLAPRPREDSRSPRLVQATPLAYLDWEPIAPELLPFSWDPDFSVPSSAAIAVTRELKAHPESLLHLQYDREAGGLVCLLCNKAPVLTVVGGTLGARPETHLNTAAHYDALIQQLFRGEGIDEARLRELLRPMLTATGRELAIPQLCSMLRISRLSDRMKRYHGR